MMHRPIISDVWISFEEYFVQIFYQELKKNIFKLLVWKSRCPICMTHPNVTHCFLYGWLMTGIKKKHFNNFNIFMLDFYKVQSVFDSIFWKRINAMFVIKGKVVVKLSQYLSKDNEPKIAVFDLSKTATPFHTTTQ